MNHKNIILSFWIFSMALLSGCGGGGSGQVQIAPNSRAILVVSGSSIYNFGNRPLQSILNQSFTVTNVGSAPADQITGSFYLSINFSYEGGSFPGSSGTCGQVLEPGNSCLVSVSFSPQALGLSQSTLQISYFNGSEISLTTSPILVGTGI